MAQKLYYEKFERIEEEGNKCPASPGYKLLSKAGEDYGVENYERN